MLREEAAPGRNRFFCPALSSDFVIGGIRSSLSPERTGALQQMFKMEN
jgi:hypothetical protein